MSSIRSKDTKPEIAFRKILFSKGVRYRIYPKDLPGKPDIIFRSSQIAIFIHGCFWHQHENCKDALLPSSRKGYWLPKLEKNIQRDKDAISSLKKMGWEIYVIWECFFKDKELIEHLANKIASTVKKRLKEKTADPTH